MTTRSVTDFLDMSNLRRVLIICLIFIEGKIVYLVYYFSLFMTDVRYCSQGGCVSWTSTSARALRRSATMACALMCQGRISAIAGQVTKPFFITYRLG